MTLSRLRRMIPLAVYLICAVGCNSHAQESAKKASPRTNRLAQETSPYLLLHAHNPVDWYPWGPEAFEKAEREGKMIFLSIGYSSCYWCHVMERESFSDPEIARFMNEHFINIKVDREERPDVDEIYMTALQIYQALSGQGGGGGWPLSMFLTPGGKPIAGGTYFPPRTIEGRIGFASVMQRLSKAWGDQKDDIVNNANLITAQLQRVMKPRLSLTTTKLEATAVAEVAQAVMNSFDPEYGGLDFDPAQPNGPKFPVPVRLALLQSRAHQGDTQAARIVAKTLNAMAHGGIRDHLGGGFHRYSTDRKWLVPHFEKMLYDNAQLADVYVTAFEQTENPLYRQVAEEVFEFVLREMTGANGAFYSAIDAETEAIEGKYYVWTSEEIVKVLGENDAALFRRVYGLEQPEFFEHGYVLHLPKSLKELAADEQITVAELQLRLGLMREKLLAVREARKSPLLDDKILTSWNGLMIRAFANGGVAFTEPRYVAAAEKAANFILANMRDSEKRLLRTYRAKTAKLNAYLDDYAFLVDGLLALHRATGNDKWLNAAERLTVDQQEMFWDEQAGGMYFTSHHHEKLLARTKNAYDSVLPSGNSVSVRNFVALAQRTGKSIHRQHAKKTLNLFAPQLKRTPTGMANMALAIAEFLALPESNETKSDPSEAGQQANTEEEPLVPLPLTLPKPDPSKPKPKVYVTATPYLSVDRLVAGQRIQLAVVLNVADKWHINANPPKPKFLIPTSVSLISELKTTLSNVAYPKGHPLEVKGFDEPLHVYEKQVILIGTIDVPAAAAGKTDTLELKLRYQACDDSRCLRPMNLVFSGKLDIAPAGTTAKPVNQRLFRPSKPD